MGTSCSRSQTASNMGYTRKPRLPFISTIPLYHTSLLIRAALIMSLQPNLLARCLCCLVLSAACLPLPSAFPDDTYSEKPGTEGNGNIVIGPDYTTDPDLTDRGNPKGKYFEFSMRLADSKIFPGTDSTLDSKKAVREVRRIFVYVPAAYKDGT